MTIDEREAGATAVERRRSSSGPRLSGWQQALLVLALAVVLAVLLKAFVLQTFSIPSQSMQPGLTEGDRVVVQKMSYWGGEPERGDVVVFEDPGSWLGSDETVERSNPVSKALASIGLLSEGGHLVKRVVGVEGDVIVCCDAKGRISVNGKALEETDYVPDEPGIDCRGPGTGNCVWEAGPVPPGKLFVLGDNRGHSEDSSARLCVEENPKCGSEPWVDVDHVVGKVALRFWPFGRFGGYEGTDAFDDVPEPS